MNMFRDYVKFIRASGKLYFTTMQALSELKISRNSLNCSIARLKKKGEIASPAKNLYIIIPPEYQKIGCLPPDELVPILMKHLGLNYYACLLTAAEIHGASHQKPQLFQVMTDKQLKEINCGRVKIKFIYKKVIDDSLVDKKVVKTGYLKVSNPELTAMDLFLYRIHSGGLNNIATVLSELIESINAEKLIQLARESAQTSWFQRLGFVLEQIDPMDEKKKNAILERLRVYMSKCELSVIPLDPSLSVEGYDVQEPWNIVNNTNIESDI